MKIHTHLRPNRSLIEPTISRPYHISRVMAARESLGMDETFTFSAPSPDTDAVVDQRRLRYGPGARVRA